MVSLLMKIRHCTSLNLIIIGLWLGKKRAIKGDQLDGLNQTTDVLMDPNTDSLFICERGDTRVMRWSRPTAAHPSNGIIQGEIVIDHIHCLGLTMDDYSALYVSDTEKHEARRYDIKDKDKQGTIMYFP